MKALEPVKKSKTLSDKAYDVIRNAIVFHELKPGDMLTEERLSEELSISRTPLRTALRRLVDDGLAEFSGKSIVVSNISDEDILDICRVRMHMELMVMDELKGKVTKRLIEELRETATRQAEASHADPADFGEYIQQDYLFHTVLAKGTGNRYLLDLSERINTHSTRCLILIPNLPYSHDMAIHEHNQIIDMLEQDDCESAKTAMQEHLSQILVRFKIVNPDRAI